MTNHEDTDADFRALFNAHYGQLVRFVERQIGNHEVAEEIASDTFLITYRKFAALESPDMRWLATVARGKIRDYRKQLARASVVDTHPIDAAHAMPAGGLDVVDEIIIREAVAELPLREREVIVLHFWAGYSPAQIAEQLGRSSVSVWKSLRRARARPHRRLRADTSNEEGEKSR